MYCSQPMSAYIDKAQNPNTVCSNDSLSNENKGTFFVLRSLHAGVF